MKERPILFSGPMVRAILEGRKTQTRRVIKLRDFGRSTTPGYYWQFRGKRDLWHDLHHDQLLTRCPYGQPGALLWVRETCYADELNDGLDGVRYLADNIFVPIANTQEAANRWLDLRHHGQSRGYEPGATVPSIFMPRWASRLTLEITGVRVERVQDITLDDSLAEGCPIDAIHSEVAPVLDDRGAIVQPGIIGPRAWFANLWDSLNAKRGYSWGSNPWVWVVEFQVVERHKT